MNKLRFTALFFSVALLAACGDDEQNEVTPDQIEVPTTYAFERNGESTVSFSGQTDRLNMLSEMKGYMVAGDRGDLVTVETLSNMYANENNPFESAELNSSTKDLESKTLISDVSYFKDLFAGMATVSADVVANSTAADAGVAGTIQRGSGGNFILVNEKGWEFTQFIEKGLMGAVFFHQIYNVYLSDERMGPDVENEELVEDENYTLKEHYFDEAFGYWGVPVDFPEELPAEDRRFWATYTYGRDQYTGSVESLKNAFLAGRTAIVNKDQDALNEARETIYKELEIVSAATAIHYINDGVSDLNNQDLGNLFHHVSEAYMFVRALKYNPFSQIATTDINTILNEDFGTNGDFWEIDAAMLNSAKARLVAAYPELADVADEL